MEIFKAEDGFSRCGWCQATENYIHYHDNDWGRPSHDAEVIFEKLCLESFQSGLSWLTILNKRDNFRRAFSGFDYKKVAGFSADDVDRLLTDSGIVRHRGKIEATINNAQCVEEIIKREGSLIEYLWQFAPSDTMKKDRLPSATEESVQMSKALKRRGWKFFGPTTAYAFMQAIGMVNDHHPDCHYYEKTEQARREFLASLS